MAQKSWEGGEIGGKSREEEEKEKLGVFLPSEITVFVLVHGPETQNVEFLTSLRDKGCDTSLETLLPLLCFFV